MARRTSRGRRVASRSRPRSCGSTSWATRSTTQVRLHPAGNISHSVVPHGPIATLYLHPQTPNPAIGAPTLTSRAHPIQHSVHGRSQERLPRHDRRAALRRARRQVRRQEAARGAPRPTTHGESRHRRGRLSRGGDAREVPPPPRRRLRLHEPTALKARAHPAVAHDVHRRVSPRWERRGGDERGGEPQRGRAAHDAARARETDTAVRGRGSGAAGVRAVAEGGVGRGRRDRGGCGDRRGEGGRARRRGAMAR